MKWALGILVAFVGAAAQEWRWFAWPVVGTLAVCGATIWLAGCAHPARWVPCPDGVTVDAHVTHGKYDGSSQYNTGEIDGYDSNYESYEFGGALHSKLGYEPSECRAWGGERPD